jgi:hypothetical protein
VKKSTKPAETGAKKGLDKVLNKVGSIKKLLLDLCCSIMKVSLVQYVSGQSFRSEIMKSIYKQGKCLVLLMLAVLILTSCGMKTPEFEKYDPMFVDRFSNEDDIDSIHVSSLVAHYYDDHYYYTVTYTQDGDDFVYELLYIFRYDSLGAFFSIKNEAECYTYFPTDYENYLKAKAEGIEKIYSSEEIADMINEFYGR